MNQGVRNTLLGAAFAAGSAFSAQAALTPILIYDAADGIATDSSGNGNNGSASSAGVTVVADGPNAGDMSFSFDGTIPSANNSSRITTNASLLMTNADIVAAGGFTMEAWIRTDGVGLGNSASVIDYAGTERIQFDSGGTDAIGFAFDGWGQVLSSVSVTDNQWHHVVAEFVVTDGSNLNAVIGTASITVDGTTDSQTGVVMSGFGDALNRPIGIGGHPIGFDGDVYAGLINDPAVYLGVVPEPGSLALLGLGGLALLRRRRPVTC